MKAKFRSLYIISTLAIIFMMSVLAADLLKINEIQKQQNRSFKLSMLWFSQQVDREARSFLQTASYYYMGYPGVEKPQLLTSFDIVWSRFGNSETEKMHQLFSLVENGQQSLLKTQLFLQEIDPLVKKLKRGDIVTFSQISDLTHKQLDVIYELSVSTIFMQESLSLSRQRSIESLYTNLLITLISLACVIAIIVALFFSSSRGLKRENVEFEQRVKERTDDLDRSNKSLIREAKIRIESQKRSQQLISAFDKSSEVLLILDAKDRFVFCNEAFKQLSQKVIDKIYPNAPYESYLRKAVNCGLFLLEDQDAEQWVQLRISELRLSEACFEVTHDSGRRFIFNRKCLEDGTVISIGTDITAQKRGQRALEASETRFRDFALIGADWFWEMGPDLAFTYFAGDIERIMGVDADFFIGKSREEVYSSNSSVDKFELERHLQKIERRESFSDYEVKWVRGDDDTVYLSISGQPRFDSDGQFIGYRGAGRDVTQRYLVEQQDQRLIAAVDSLNLIITIFDSDDHLIFFNRKFKEFNVDIAPLIYMGMSFQELWLISARNQTRKTGVDSSHWYEKRMNMHRNPGKTFVIPWEDGKYMQVYEQSLVDGGTIIVATDISENKKAEQQISHLRNYLVNIIDSMPSILIGVDQYCRVTQWNLAAEKETGILLKDALQLDLEKVFPRLKVQIPKLLDAIESKQEVTHPKSIHWKKDKARYEDITIYPLNAGGGSGAVIRLDDVTEQVLLSEMMIQSEKMLSVGGLAAGMAHEINNPLAGMMQTANVMLSRLSDQNLTANIEAAKGQGIALDAVTQYMQQRGIIRMAKNIIDSSERVAVIVENMLSFARQNEAITTTYSLASLMDKSLELSSTDYNLKKDFDFRSIKVFKEYQKNMQDVLCEGPKIQQVLLNILRNGAQAMQEAAINDPTFVLRTYYQAKTNEAVIEIEDNGPGINESVRRRIFEPFFTTKAEGQGTGLGLSVSFFIITENHNGKMSVESEQGKGAKFIIKLPMEERISTVH